MNFCGTSSIAQVVFPLRIDKVFDYAVDASTRSLCQGQRVGVDFNGKTHVALVVGFSSHGVVGKRIKPIISVLDTEPSLHSSQVLFARQLSRYYLYSWGELAFMMLPSSLKKLRKIEAPKFRECTQVKPINQPDLLYYRASTFHARYLKYKALIEENIERGSTVICLPLRARITCAVEFLQKDFGDKVVVMHSYQTPKQELDAWFKVRRGKIILVGIRGIVFRHPPDTSLVIVDQENSSYFFQEEKPFYHTRDVAMILQQQINCMVACAGVYPSLAVYKLAKEQKLYFQETPEEEKKIELIDTRNFQGKKSSVFSPFLIELIRRDLAQGKRVLFIWERAHYSTILRCDSCNEILYCHNCSSPLKLSAQPEYGVCTWCGYAKKFEKICVTCAEGYVKPVGVGILRLKSMLRKFFPEYGVSLWDEKVKDSMILLSTWKIVSSERIEGIHSCYILDVDSFLTKVDFNRTFDLFIKIKELRVHVDGTVYVFSSFSDHYPWTMINQPWRVFYDQELNVRRQMGYPPYGSVMKVVVRGKDKKSVFKKINNLYNKFQSKGLETFGPFEEVPFRLRSVFRYSVIVKERDRKKLLSIADPVVKSFISSACKIAIMIM